MDCQTRGKLVESQGQTQRRCLALFLHLPGHGSWLPKREFKIFTKGKGVITQETFGKIQPTTFSNGILLTRS